MGTFTAGLPLCPPCPVPVTSESLTALGPLRTLAKAMLASAASVSCPPAPPPEQALGTLLTDWDWTGCQAQGQDTQEPVVTMTMPLKWSREDAGHSVILPGTGSEIGKAPWLLEPSQAMVGAVTFLAATRAVLGLHRWLPARRPGLPSFQCPGFPDTGPSQPFKACPHTAGLSQLCRGNVLSLSCLIY